MVGGEEGAHSRGAAGGGGDGAPSQEVFIIPSEVPPNPDAVSDGLINAGGWSPMVITKAMLLPLQEEASGFNCSEQAEGALSTPAGASG